MEGYFYPAKKIGQFGDEGSHCGELWVGSARDAADVPWLREHGFGLVVNCTRHLPFARIAGVKFVRVDVNDDPAYNEKMFEALPSATREIARALENEVNVLVHCHAGMQRSATVAAAALYYMRVAPMSEIVTRMSEIKPEVFPRAYDGKPTFTEALRAWMRVCRNRGNSL
jgi:rhodanese-related sulfurtransferase